MEDKPKKCPRCGNTEFYVYPTKFGFSKYMCKACKKSFQLQYLRKEATKGVVCPSCGSTDIMRRGFRKGIQKYGCKTCNRSFQAEYVKQKKPNRPRKRPIPKPIERPMPKPINIDSIVGIPCFGCYEKNGINTCDARYCEKLTEWLLKNV